jgi:autotransporter passenger strand-loop-strand repeat protein
VSNGGKEIVSSGGLESAATIDFSGTLEVSSGGTVDSVVFGSGGILQIDSVLPAAFGGTISNFHSGDEIDLRGLAFDPTSGGTLSWTQLTSGATASGTLTVKEGTSSKTLTLVGSYSLGNFSVTSDGSGGTLIEDPPVVTSGGSVATSTGASSGGSMDILPASAATVISGGYELGASADTAGDTNNGGTDRGVFFSGGGMVQLDAALSQFAGVVSGFHLGDEVDLQSLGFGSSSSAAPWLQQTSRVDGAGPASVDGGGHIFSLTLLGQYAANFSAGSNGHDGSLITDPPSAASVVGPPVSMTVAHS